MKSINKNLSKLFLPISTEGNGFLFYKINAPLATTTTYIANTLKSSAGSFFIIATTTSRTIWRNSKKVNF